MYDDMIKARVTLKELVKIVNMKILEDVEVFIDGLDETTCKDILRMIAYGGYKDFINED